jgi:hypothetical protein|tara:strand:- start:1113 stop:1751 length:639 start_codon:yes stop_codon:yes gene_type:complete
MANDTTDQILPIAELLPEGLSEAAISEIANLVNTVISEQVEERTKVLEAKAKSFIRLRVDELKDHAMRELEQENETVHNAHLFEAVKTLMALEIGTNDQDNAISGLVQEQETFDAEVTVLTEELEKAYTQNERTDHMLKSLTKKVEKLETERDTLVEAVANLEESAERPFKSSEKAIMVTNGADSALPPKEDIYENTFLTSEVMKFMPQIKK